MSIGYNPEALTTRDNKGETPLDIARRSGACAEIIGLLSQTPEEALSLGGKGILRLYAPVGLRSYADCPKTKIACREIIKVLRLTPKDISSTPFPTLLRKYLPKQFVDSSIYGPYNTVCTFIKHMKYDKAELLKVEDVLKKPARQCDVCKTPRRKRAPGAKPATSAAPSARRLRGRSTKRETDPQVWY